MSYQVVSEGDGPDYEIHTCDNCGRTTVLSGVGGDVACCPCEFENEGQSAPAPVDHVEVQAVNERRAKILSVGTIQEIDAWVFQGRGHLEVRVGGRTFSLDTKEDGSYDLYIVNEDTEAVEFTRHPPN